MRRWKNNVPFLSVSLWNGWKTCHAIVNLTAPFGDARSFTTVVGVAGCVIWPCKMCIYRCATTGSCSSILKLLFLTDYLLFRWTSLCQLDPALLCFAVHFSCISSSCKIAACLIATKSLCFEFATEISSAKNLWTKQMHVTEVKLVKRFWKWQSQSECWWICSLQLKTKTGFWAVGIANLFWVTCVPSQ